MSMRMISQSIRSSLKMRWPDPECHGPHKPRQRLVRWMHTDKCLAVYPVRNKSKEDEIDSLPEDATIVERGRAVGAI